MKVIATCALAIALLGDSPPAVSPVLINGTWEGAFSRNGSIQVVDITFSTNRSGQLQASYSIPELTLYDERVQNVALDGNQLSMKFLYGAFTSLVNSAENEITGTDAGWNPPIRLDIKRAIFSQVY